MQGDDLPGLQVQNAAGEWIDCPPLDGCFVVNMGTLLETASWVSFGVGCDWG